MATTINQMRKKISRVVSENPKYKTSSRAFKSKTVGRYKRLITQFCQLHIVKTSNWLYSFWRTTSNRRCSPSRIEVDVSLKKKLIKVDFLTNELAEATCFYDLLLGHSHHNHKEHIFQCSSLEEENLNNLPRACLEYARRTQLNILQRLPTKVWLLKRNFSRLQFQGTQQICYNCTTLLFCNIKWYVPHARHKKTPNSW